MLLIMYYINNILIIITSHLLYSGTPWYILNDASKSNTVASSGQDQPGNDKNTLRVCLF